MDTDRGAHVLIIIHFTYKIASMFGTSDRPSRGVKKTFESI